MTRQVNIYDAKTNLSQLIDRVSEGEEIIIARAGRPVARLIGWQRAVSQRTPGRLRGRIRVGRNFDDPLPADLFEPE